MSVNDRVISPFREDFIFAKFRENKTIAKIPELTVSNRMELSGDWHAVNKFALAHTFDPWGGGRGQNYIFF